MTFTCQGEMSWASISNAINLCTWPCRANALPSARSCFVPLFANARYSLSCVGLAKGWHVIPASQGNLTDTQVQRAPLRLWFVGQHQQVPGHSAGMGCPRSRGLARSITQVDTAGSSPWPAERCPSNDSERSSLIRSAPQRLSDQSPKFDDGFVTVGTVEAKTTIGVCDITACSSTSGSSGSSSLCGWKSRIVKTAA